MIRNTYKRYSLLFFSIWCLSSCSKLVDISDPRTSIQTSEAFSSNDLANSALAGIFSQMMTNSGTFNFSNGAMSVYPGLSSDELINADGVNSITDYQFMTNTLNKENGIAPGIFWGPVYKIIFNANAAIGGIAASTSPKLEQPMRDVLTGEAKFVRAFCYFYLVNLFGDVPLVTTTNFNNNIHLARTPVADVYKQIVQDLKDAQALLRTDFSMGNNERIRPNKWAATALLARVYLYMGDWQNAEAESNAVITNSQFKLVTDLKNVFNKNSTEAIWQLQQNTSKVPYNGTYDGMYMAPLFAWADFDPLTRLIFLDSATFVSNAAYIVPKYYCSQELLKAFENGDKRRAVWTSYVETPNIQPYNGDTILYPCKYTVTIGSSSAAIPQYYMVLRLAEQFLIRAEAKARRGSDLNGAAADLDSVRIRAGLPKFTNIAQDPLIQAIARERRVELFAEWGHRWMDLKRTGKAKEILSTITRKQPFDDRQLLYPISPLEIQNDPLLEQNPGYDR